MRKWPGGSKARALQLQWAIVGLVGACIAFAWYNASTNLARRNITGGFEFLGHAARFPISESLLNYSPTDTFGWAFLVGLTNTLFLSVVIGASATVLGLIVGLARRSRHPLVYGLAMAFVELLRNTPLVVQLLFWYALVTVGLPPSHDAFNAAPGVFLTDRGLFVPQIQIIGNVGLLTIAVLVTLAAVMAATRYGYRLHLRTGKPNHYGRIATGMGLAALLAVWTLGRFSIAVEQPTLERFNFSGGMTLTPEFVALALGLVLYSTAFTAEIIRGGIDAISKGQWEAGRAIGLSERHTLRLVIIPQALRVIIPPMTSQYINIVKNTTLALIVGYPDIAFVTATTINQTGQAIEGIAILMLVFLTISVLGSILMNAYNRRIALTER